MWILTILPDWIWSLLIVAGIGSLLAGWFIKIYQLPLQLAGILAIVLGTWFTGAAHNEAVWQSKIKELEEKLKVAEVKSNEVTEKIVYKTKEKVFVVKQAVDVVRKEIEIQKEIVNEGCKLNPTAVKLYNDAVTGGVK
jgi:hypothetical protein